MTARALRVLHVVGAMPRAGTETWLMHLLKHVDRSVLAMDFLVHVTEPQAYDDAIREQGARLIPCLGTYGRYAKNFLGVLAANGPYDIVHSHVQHFGGVVLSLAAIARVPVRIAHSHNDTVAETVASGWGRRMYVRLMNALIRWYATHGIAVSRRAAVALFGPDWARDRRWRVMLCGLDLRPYESHYDRAAIRTEFGVPSDALVIGHVGRFVEQKNHRFLLDVFDAVVRQHPEAVLMLGGDGPLRADIERRADALGLTRSVRFLGIRDDVPKLMSGLFDVLLFPSRWEGLGLVLVEAQAAGLPCVISDAIPFEADIVQPLICRMPLAASADEWASSVLAASRTGRPRSRPDTREWVFSIDVNAAALLGLYQGPVVNGQR